MNPVLYFLGSILVIFIYIYIYQLYNTKKLNIIGTKNIIDVVISEKSFSQNNILLNRGDSLRIINKSPLRHSFFIEQYDISNIPLLKQYDNHKTVFMNEGTFYYKSSLYDDMEDLKIIVV